MGISISGGVKVPQGKFKVYVTPPPLLPAVKSLWSWGDNSPNGQLGDGTTVDKSSPVQIGFLTDWSSIDAGQYHTLATKIDGTMWAWGDGSLGRLGDGTVVDRNSPVQIAGTDWSSVSADNHSHAIKTDGTLWAWGRNGGGYLGLGNTTFYSSPVQVGILTDWNIVSAGQYHTLAIKTDGTLWAWGLASFGRLGNGDINIKKSSPIQIGALTNWASLGVGGVGRSHSHAVKTDSTLWGWGNNNVGQLGDGTTTLRNSPVQIGSLTDWSSVGSAQYHTVALKINGTLWSWGDGYNGRLGLGDTADRSSPSQIGTDTNWASIVVGSDHTLAIRTDGTLWAWGQNSFGGAIGAIGDGVTINRSSPVQIGLLTTWSGLGGGRKHSHALRTE